MIRRVSCRGLVRALGDQATQNQRALSYSAASQHKSSISEQNVITSNLKPVELPNMTLPDFLCKDYDQKAKLPIFTDGQTGKTLIFAEVFDLARRFGSALIKRGVKKGDVVAIISPNSIYFPVIIMGTTGIGATVTTVNATSTPDEIVKQLVSSKAQLLITVPQLLENARTAVGKGKTDVKNIVVSGKQDGCLSLDDMLSDSGSAYPTSLNINASKDVACIMYSSGTTGVPKGVMLTHLNYIVNIQQMCDKTFGDWSYGAHRAIHILPYFHAAGMFGVYTALHCAINPAVHARFSPEIYIEAIRKHKPTTLATAPPLLHFLTTHPSVTISDLSCVERVGCGAAPLSPSLAHAFLDRFPKDKRPTLINAWGMTELTTGGTCSPAEKPVIGKVGIALPSTEYKIVDLNTGEALGPDQEGELCIRGPQVMKGYLNNEKAKRETIDKDGWLHTGDIAFYDKDHYFEIVDRLKELIKVKGLQVSPAELENVLISHPGILDAAVVGVPDDRAGELPRAYVILKDKSLTEKQIADYVKELVAPHKQLNGGVKITDVIPKSPAGKILRKELRKMASVPV